MATRKATLQDVGSEDISAVEPEEKMVTIQLFKDEERYKEDLFVAVNGRTFLVQRGIPVDVPEYVAEVIQHSLDQDKLTAAMMTRMAERYVTATEEKTKPV